MMKSFLLALALLGGNSSFAFNVSLAPENSEPSICQETNNWCGAAAAQMILQGYPDGEKYFVPQKTAWETIKRYNDDKAVSWATDPDGLAGTLNWLGKNGVVDWRIAKDPKPEGLMHAMLSSLSKSRYPATVLVYGFQHWIVVDGFKTDADPAQRTDVKLEQVEITNPWPPCDLAVKAGVRSIVSAETWYDKYWYATGKIEKSKWNDNFVAIFNHAGTTEGRAPAAAVSIRIDGEVNATEIARRAKAYLTNFRATKGSDFTVLEKAKPQAPLRVLEMRGQYYLVPLRLAGAKKDVGAMTFSTNGRFEEIGVFGAPGDYFGRFKAPIGIADQVVEIGYVFRPSEETKSRLLPARFYRTDNQVFYQSTLR